MFAEENGQICPTGQSCTTISYFETLPIGSSTHYADRSSGGESGNVQVTATVFSSAPPESSLK